MLKFFSPAKLNLFFRVLCKRSDAYHEIASLYQAIDLGDDLILEKAIEDRLICSDPTLPCDETNLVWKALKLFRQHYQCPPVQIDLLKRVPMQAGLGGGSSNAATALWALNQWTGEPATIEELRNIGSKIGSDVAFFFSSGTAYCTGRGEILEPFPDLSIDGYLAKPGFGLSTPLVYRETRVDELPDIDPKIARDSFLTAAPQFFNDLEKAAFRIEPRLIQFKEQLLSLGFQTVSMTGSGTAFFCLKGAPKSAIIHFIPFCSLNRPLNAWYSR